MTGEIDIEAAARNLARTTPLSLADAREELNRVAGGRVTAAVFDEWKGETVPDAETDPHLFMTKEGIDRGDMSAALREYRNLDTWDSSPWEREEIGVLSTDFINWYRWERL